MLELSHGEIGWDVFTLEYKVDHPLDVIVTPYCARQYLKVFNFLWRVKRVEFAITASWRRSHTGSRGAVGAVDNLVGKDWKRVRGGCAEMIHFLCQLQYYILFEVPDATMSVELMHRLLNLRGIHLLQLFRRRIVRLIP
jgi:gamma-tubulin complex component 3